jgi:predicted exporter
MIATVCLGVSLAFLVAATSAMLSINTQYPQEPSGSAFVDAMMAVARARAFRAYEVTALLAGAAVVVSFYAVFFGVSHAR